jgi:Xaa-Pro aminopeptidase
MEAMEPLIEPPGDITVGDLPAQRYPERLQRLWRSLEELEVEAMFLPPSADLEYLTGVPRLKHESDPSWDKSGLAQGCLIARDRSPVFLLGHGEWRLEVLGMLEHEDVHMVSAGSDPIAHLQTVGRTTQVRRRLAVGDWTSFRQVEALQTAFPEAELVPASQLMLPLRLRKDEFEVRQIRRACEIAINALETTLGRFGPSFVRQDFLDELAHQLLLNGSEGLGYRPDFCAAGPSTSIQWAADCRGQARAEINAPASVTVDFGAVFAGYRSDMGRTVFVGEPPDGAAAAFRVIQEAQEEALNTLRGGVAPENVDAAARSVVSKAGLGDAFTNPTGHGIGLEIHEPPRLVAGMTEPLPSGAVVTLEPGAWRDGSLAVFCEDEVVVRSEGAERMVPRATDAYVV